MLVFLTSLISANETALMPHCRLILRWVMCLALYVTYELRVWYGVGDVGWQQLLESGDPVLSGRNISGLGLRELQHGLGTRRLVQQLEGQTPLWQRHGAAARTTDDGLSLTETTNISTNLANAVCPWNKQYVPCDCFHPRTVTSRRKDGGSGSCSFFLMCLQAVVLACEQRRRCSYEALFK